jgi:hypothetical protein
MIAEWEIQYLNYIRPLFYYTRGNTPCAQWKNCNSIIIKYIYFLALGAGHNTMWEVLNKYLEGTPKNSNMISTMYLGSIGL